MHNGIDDHIRRLRREDERVGTPTRWDRRWSTFRPFGGVDPLAALTFSSGHHSQSEFSTRSP